MFRPIRVFLYICFILLFTGKLSAQEKSVLSLPDVLNIAEKKSYISKKLNIEKSVQELELDIFRKSFFPTIDIALSAPSINRSISPIPQDDGTIKFRESNTANSSISLDIQQNIARTGGTISINNSINRLDQLGSQPSGSYSGSWLGISYRQPIGSYNAFKSSKKVNHTLQKKQVLELAQDNEQLLIDVIRLYFDLYIAQMKLNLSRNSSKNSELYYNLAKEKYDRKSISKPELTKVELSYIENINHVINDSINYKTALANLLNSSGIDYKFILKEPELPNLRVTDLNIEFITKLCLDNYYEQNSYQKVKSEEQTKKAKSERMSTSFNVGYGFNNSANNIDDLIVQPQNQQSVNFSIQKTLLDWNIAKRKEQIAEKKEQMVRISIEDSANKTKREITNLVNSLMANYNNIELYKKRIALSEMNFEQTSNTYLLNKSSLIELNISSLKLESAIIEYVEKLKSLWLTYYQIRKKTLYDFESSRHLY